MRGSVGRWTIGLRRLVALVLLLVLPLAGLGGALAQEGAAARVALVIGNGAYRFAPRASAANDAGLMAETLAAAGFEVTGARDLNGEGLRQAVHEFLDKAASAGPAGIAVVYLAGHALDFDGDNYFVPVDAALARPADVPIECFRLSDLTRALAALGLKARLLIVDGAYAMPSQPNAPGAAPALYRAGLGLADPEPGLLLAFNAAPGTTATDRPGPYGLYAESLSQTMKEGGVPVEEIFAQVRVAVNTATHGAVLPWNTGAFDRSFAFFERAANAPAIGSAQVPFASLQSRPLKDFSPEQAYDVAIARDNFAAYQDYLTAFPEDPLARRIRVVLALRREASFWREALRDASPAAFWTYLKRYPKGPHLDDAHRRLNRLSAAVLPPAGFAPIDFAVPPPAEAEYAVFDHPAPLLAIDLAAPPPPPLFLLPPPPAEPLAPPPAEPGLAHGLLPIPAAMAIPFVRVLAEPGIILPPRGLKGAYPRPRPFARAPSGSGLIPLPAEQQQPGKPPAAAAEPLPAATLPTLPLAAGPRVAAPAPQKPPRPMPVATPLGGKPQEDGKPQAGGKPQEDGKPIAPVAPAAAAAPLPLPAGTRLPATGDRPIVPGAKPPIAGRQAPAQALRPSAPAGPPKALDAGAPPMRQKPQPALPKPVQSPPALRPVVAAPPLLHNPPKPPALAPAHPQPRPIPQPSPQGALGAEARMPIEARRPGGGGVPPAAIGPQRRNPDCGHPGQPLCRP